MTSPSKPFSKWKESDVTEWLEENDDLEKYSDEFLQQNITGETLINSYQAGTLPDDLKEVGFCALEDRNHVIRFVKQSTEQENLAQVTVEPEIQIQTKQDTQKTITGFFKSVSLQHQAKFLRDINIVLDFLKSYIESLQQMVEQNIELGSRRIVQKEGEMRFQETQKKYQD